MQNLPSELITVLADNLIDPRPLSNVSTDVRARVLQSSRYQFYKNHKLTPYNIVRYADRELVESFYDTNINDPTAAEEFLTLLSICSRDELRDLHSRVKRHLSCFSSQNHIEVVKYLISARADITPNGNPYNAFMYAMHNLLQPIATPIQPQPIATPKPVSRSIIGRTIDYVWHAFGF